MYNVFLTGSSKSSKTGHSIPSRGINFAKYYGGGGGGGAEWFLWEKNENWGRGEKNEKEGQRGKGNDQNV